MDAPKVHVVPLLQVLRAFDCHSAGLINTTDFRKSKGKVFSWNGRAWTCVATLSQASIWHWAEIIEVVPEKLYTGTAHRKGARGYTGVRFKCNGQIWVMTANKIRLVPDEKPQAQVEQQLSLFAR